MIRLAALAALLLAGCATHGEKACAFAHLLPTPFAIGAIAVCTFDIDKEEDDLNV